MELEEPVREFKLTIDRRPRVPEPLPVRLVTIDDARLPAAAGLERDLDAFYVGILGFERAESPDTIVYRSDNFFLRFDVREPPVQRTDMRPLGVEVPSIAELEPKLLQAAIEYERRRGLLPGEELIVLTDPAGNWIEIADIKPV